MCARPGVDWVSGTDTHVRAFLGPGDDHAQVWQHGRVSGGADELWGHLDEDTADGGPGRDTCEAEVQVSC